MNGNRVAMQGLSLASAINSTHLSGDQAPAGVTVARNVNNELKRAVDANATRFRAFAENCQYMPLWRLPESFVAASQT